MSANPLTEWVKTLPVGLLDLIVYDWKHSLSDLWEVNVHQESFVSLGTGLTFEVRFRDDSRFTCRQDIMHSFIAQTLIDGYNDVLSPNVWLERIIMERRDTLPVPNYARPEEAFHVLKRFFSLPDDSKLLFSFVFRLLAKERLDKDELIPAFRMMVMVNPWTPKEICTAAYQAYCYEVSMRGYKEKFA